jgi:nucleotide-binding universal stress UspA family protein
LIEKHSLEFESESSMEQTYSLFNHILVPSDGSQSSLAAGRLAISLAKQHQAHVTFVYVVDNKIAEELSVSLHKPIKQTQEDLANSARQYLTYLSRLAISANVTTDQITRYGMPYIEIEKLAREKKVDLIVIGQISHRGPRHMLIGSVAQRVIENAPCPVLIVK